MRTPRPELAPRRGGWRRRQTRGRIGELIERASEAMQQAGALLAKANAAVMLDLQALVEATTRPQRP